MKETNFSATSTYNQHIKYTKSNYRSDNKSNNNNSIYVDQNPNLLSSFSSNSNINDKCNGSKPVLIKIRTPRPFIFEQKKPPLKLLLSKSSDVDKFNEIFGQDLQRFVSWKQYKEFEGYTLQNSQLVLKRFEKRKVISIESEQCCLNFGPNQHEVYLTIKVPRKCNKPYVFCLKGIGNSKDEAMNMCALDVIHELFQHNKIKEARLEFDADRKTFCGMNRDKKLDAYLHQTSTDTFCAKIDELRRHESNLY